MAADALKVGVVVHDTNGVLLNALRGLRVVKWMDVYSTSPDSEDKTHINST